MKPSEYYKYLRWEAMEAVRDDFTGSAEEWLWMPVIFALLAATMTLEGFWQAVELFVDLDD